MKKSSYNFVGINDTAKVLTIIMASQLAVVSMISGCSKNIETLNDIEPETSTIESTFDSMTETNPTIIEDYNFDWGQAQNEGFNDLVVKEYGVQSLTSYICYFGFSNELNQLFTEYVNECFDTNYQYVPFSEAKYFRSYISMKDYDYYHIYRDDYDRFCNRYMDDRLSSGSFKNKLILAYLIENNLPFGSIIPIEYLKNFYEDDFYTLEFADYVRNNSQLGNYSGDYRYDNKELLYALTHYNNDIFYLAFSEGNATKDFYTTDPEFTDICAEGMEIFNGYLVQYYGEGCVQFGEVPTRETFEKMFPGETYPDLSVIPGAIVNTAEVKGSTKARYDDNIDNYELSYLPGYEYHTEEVEETTRSR